LKRKILLVEKRSHIGGNAFDYYNEDGILVHKYGPHIFHTNYEDVWKYLSQFTLWNGYQHRVLAHVDGKKVPIPINLTTVNTLLGKNFTEKELKDYFVSVRLKLDTINNSRDVIISQVGKFFYEKFFKNYTFKQWGVYPEELSPEVTKRIPIRYSNDDRYFSDKYQGLPDEGYSKLFEKLLSHKNITVVLNTDYKKVIDTVQFNRLIYTGPIDYFFDYKYGPLPYRSLKFESETLNKEYFQEVSVINYPNDYEFTRITEFKHMTLQKHPKTTIIREYPKEHGEPYYPLPMEKALNLSDKYKKEALKLKSVYLIGRLAEYKYYNMDQVVKRALDTFESIAKDC
jgi:UDP-galactopyranose mutase